MTERDIKHGQEGLPVEVQEAMARARAHLRATMNDPAVKDAFRRQRERAEEAIRQRKLKSA